MIVPVQYGTRNCSEAITFEQFQLIKECSKENPNQKTG